MLEVDEKIEEVVKLSKSELEDYISDNVVPVVRSPDGELYVVDKHHFLSVCYHVGMKKVKVEIIKDFHSEKVDYIKFWKWMASSSGSSGRRAGLRTVIRILRNLNERIFFARRSF